MQKKIIGFVSLVSAAFFIFSASTLLYARPASHWLWQIAPSTPMAHFVAAINPSDPDLLLAIGRYFFNHGSYDLERAKRAYERALELDPNSVIAHYQLGRIFFLRGDFFQAMRHIDWVLGIDPEYAKGYYMQGLVLGYRGDLLTAIEAFREYVRRVPHEWAGYNDLAWLHFQLGQYEEVLAVSEAGLAQIPGGNAWLLNMRGLALMHLNRPEEARRAFEQADKFARTMAPADWGAAYPGNDPVIYAEGLERMREAIEHNLELVRLFNLGSEARE